MADRKSYPSIPERNWWELRRRFLSRPPKGEVTAAYLSDVLGIQEKAAANLLPSLRVVGLIDDAGKPTPRASKWRDDEQYTEVTREIIAEVYPQGLLDAAPPDHPEVATAQRWFLRETGTGQARANMLAAFYRLLAEGDPLAGEEGRRRAAERQATEPQRRTARAAAQRRSSGDGSSGDPDEAAVVRKAQLPSLSVAVQVYVDKNMTAEQVDHVFASMAKHLYGKE